MITTDTAPRTRVTPWETMTPRLQAEHLVYCHGYDHDYYDQQGLTDPEVVEAFVTVRAPLHPDYSYPHPSARDDLHNADHADGIMESLCGQWRHTHNKPVSISGIDGEV